MSVIVVNWGKSSIVTHDWKEIANYLNNAREGGGIIRLRNSKNTLALQMDNGQDLCLPIIHTTHKGDLRFYHDPEKEMRQIYFDGNLEYDALLTDDFNLVLRLAKEFFDTGDVKCMLPEKDLPPAIDEYEDD